MNIITRLTCKHEFVCYDVAEYPIKQKTFSLLEERYGLMWLYNCPNCDKKIAIKEKKLTDDVVKIVSKVWEEKLKGADNSKYANEKFFVGNMSFSSKVAYLMKKKKKYKGIVQTKVIRYVNFRQ